MQNPYIYFMYKFLSDPITTATIFPLIVGVILYFILQRQRKELSYSILTSSSLISINGSLNKEIEILYHKEKVYNLSIMKLLIKNTGNQAIVAEDYEIPIKFNFNENSKIFSAEIIYKAPKILNPILLNEKKYFILKPLLLNKNDEFVIKVVISNLDIKTFSLEYRIKNIPLIKNKRSTSNLLVNMAGIIGIILMMTSYITFFSTNWTAIGIITVILLIAELSFIGIHLFEEQKRKKQEKLYID